MHPLLDEITSALHEKEQELAAVKEEEKAALEFINNLEDKISSEKAGFFASSADSARRARARAKVMSLQEDLATQKAKLEHIQERLNALKESIRLLQSNDSV